MYFYPIKSAQKVNGLRGKTRIKCTNQELLLGYLQAKSQWQSGAKSLAQWKQQHAIKANADRI